MYMNNTKCCAIFNNKIIDFKNIKKCRILPKLGTPLLYLTLTGLVRQLYLNVLIFSIVI